MIKYILEVQGFKGEQWEVTIDVDSYSGSPINIIGSNNPIEISWDNSSSDNPFSSHIVTQSCVLRVFNDNIDVTELQLCEDSDIKCLVKCDGVIKHQGFIVSDGIQETDSGVASELTIKSIDGLEFLKTRKFTWGNNYGTITVDGTESVRRCPMNAIRLAIYLSPNLGNVLPIRWATSLKSHQYPNDDMLAGRNKIIGDRGDIISVSDKSLWWYLEEICKTAHCWLYQKDGYWYIENRGDTIKNNGTFNGYEIDELNPTENKVANAISIGSSDVELSSEFINENSYWITNKPVGGVNVTYIDTTEENNVVPNGYFNFDYGSISSNLRYWGFYNTPVPLGDDLYAKKYEDDSFNKINIDGRNEGWSLDCAFSMQGTTPTYPDAQVSFDGSIPLDAKTLFKGATFGFDVMPLNGFPFDSDGFIKLEDKPLKVKVLYNSNDGNDNSRRLYLNGFGFWQWLPPNGFMKMNIISTGGKSWRYDFSGGAVSGDVLTVRFKYTNIGVTTEHKAVYIAKKEDEVSLSTFIDNAILSIKSQLKPVANWSVTKSGDSINIVNTFSGTITQESSNISTGSNTLNEDGSFNIEIGQGAKIGDVIRYSFQGKGGNSLIQMPDPGNIPVEGNNVIGTLKIYFYLKEGQRYVLDNVYFKVENNHDVYEIKSISSKSPNIDLNVGISTSFNGHMLSNYMDNYSLASESFSWYYRGIKSSLTEHYGRFALDWLNKPNRVFSGDVDMFVQVGDYINIKNTKYIVINSTYNIGGVSSILAFEASLNENDYTVEHKSSGAN